MRLIIDAFKNSIILILFAGCVFLFGCTTNELSTTNSPPLVKAPPYKIGPGDQLNVFVWGNPDLSVDVFVRPDGYITTPLVEDVQASGKTSTQLAREMEYKLSHYVKNPKITITVIGFVGRSDQQIKVVGAATTPKAIPYKENMTLLDVMLAVGGLTEFAAGNKTTLVRKVGGVEKKYRVRVDDLINDGDMSANINMLPGDVLIIPEAWF